MEEQSLCEIVRKAERDYVYNTTTLGKYVQWSMHETIERIDAYLNSKHISGAKDSLNRDKPFFNIVTAAANIWYRATDLDRKDIKFVPQSQKSIPLAFVANIVLQKWMDDNNFGHFLNSWGRSLAEYGSTVVKFVEKNGKLIPSVIPWNRLIVDPVDFDALPHIEKFYKTESQLYKMVRENGYDKAQVEALCDSLTTRKTLDAQVQDTVADFIELYEVHGELSQAVYKKAKGLEVVEGDDDIYFQQMHVISFVQVGTGEDAVYEDYTLYVGREAQDPYMITHLIERDGRTLAIGAVEYLFDAQWMQNHTMKNLKDTLDLSSKLIFQTADKNYLGRNVLKAIETGDIMVYDDGKPLTEINNSKADVTALMNFSGMWKALSQDLTSTPDAIRGNTLPSGTPYSLAAYAGAQANSLFEVMTENKGIAIENMLKKYVIPNVKKSLKNKDEILAILDDAGIQEIDSMYLPRKAVEEHNKGFKQAILNGQLPTPFNLQQAQMTAQAGMASMGNRRSFVPSEASDKTWADIFSDFEWESIKVEVTNENDDKQAVLTTLSSILQTAVNNPDLYKLIMNKILTETGAASPLQLATTPVTPPMPTASPPTVGAGALPVNQLNGGK